MSVKFRFQWATAGQRVRVFPPFTLMPTLYLMVEKESLKGGVMARIRTIKPEFPHSESMGRVSRDARLLFVQLWTLCDDSGRTRGNSRMLASLLFPYDDDAPKLIDGWMEELEREACVVRYFAEDTNYLQICNWLNHQKIDKPSPSKIPPFDESSRTFAKPRELSSEDQGSRIKDQGVDQGSIAPATAVAPAAKKPRVVKIAKPLPDGFQPNAEGVAYALARKVDLESEITPFRNWHTAKGSTMKDWDAAWRTWCDKAVEFGRAGNGAAKKPVLTGRQAAVSSYAAQAAAARGEEDEQQIASGSSVRDITGECTRVEA